MQQSTRKGAFLRIARVSADTAAARLTGGTPPRIMLTRHDRQPDAVGVRILRRNKANCDIIGLAPGFSGWAGVITAIVGMVILVVVFVFHRDELSEYGISMGAASAVGVVYFLWSCPVTYRVDFSGITKRRCGIPVRFVAWEQISQIGHAQLGRGACLIITLVGCEKFSYRKGDSESYWAENYLIRHMRKTLCIQNVKAAIPIIEKYYGALDYDYMRDESDTRP